ncbi:hypothetical protein SDJN02_17504, partial [Cucurbita argyrosperma subsp. argyrosperma]
MILKLDTGRCASEEAEPQRGVDTRRCANKDAGPRSFAECIQVNQLEWVYIMKNEGDLFSSPTNVGHHNPPPSGPSVLAGTRSFIQSNVGPPPNPPPFGVSVLTGTPPRVYPLRGTARRPTHCPVTGSNTNCNDPDSLLADIVLFGLFPSSFPSKDFHTLT